MRGIKRKRGAPANELPDSGVIGADEAALEPEREAVGPLEAQEVGGDRRELPQDHLPSGLSSSPI